MPAGHRCGRGGTLGLSRAGHDGLRDARQHPGDGGGQRRRSRSTPTSRFAHGQLGLAHAMGGRAAEAVACIDHALRLSPREAFLGDFQFYYAVAYFQGANYELGLQFAREAHRLRPGHAYPLVIGVACAGHLDDKEAAAGLLEGLKANGPRCFKGLCRGDSSLRPRGRPIAPCRGTCSRRSGLAAWKSLGLSQTRLSNDRSWHKADLGRTSALER